MARFAESMETKGGLADETEWTIGRISDHGYREEEKARDARDAARTAICPRIFCAINVSVVYTYKAMQICIHFTGGPFGRSRKAVSRRRLLSSSLILIIS